MIIYSFENVKTRKILLPWDDKRLVFKAGMPIANDGSIANNANAVGLLARPVFPNARSLHPDGHYYGDGEIITEGYVDLKSAQEESGITYTSEAISALTGILLVSSKWESVSNKTTTISEASTDTQYPSAKAVYDFLANYPVW